MELPYTDGSQYLDVELHKLEKFVPRESVGCAEKVAFVKLVCSCSASNNSNKTLLGYWDSALHPEPPYRYWNALTWFKITGRFQ